MLSNTIMEKDKEELTLSINSFSQPKVWTEAAAWSQLMLDLIFLTPGTYPSIPAMGVGIDQYQYDFLDDVLTTISEAITSQQRAYLPDIPLAGLQVTKMEYNGENILLIQMTFNASTGATSSAIAVSTTPTRLADVEVSWT